MTDQSLQRGFFIALAAIPVTYAIIQYTREGQTPYFTRVIRETYDDISTKWARRNDLHTQMIEQAGADRVLFLNESSRRLPDLRYPEYVSTPSSALIPTISMLTSVRESGNSITARHGMWALLLTQMLIK